jgi:hypothetical protein
VAKPAPESPAVMEQLMGGGDRMSDHRIQISGGPDGRRCATERTSKVRGNAFALGIVSTTTCGFVRDSSVMASSCFASYYRNGTAAEHQGFKLCDTIRKAS